MGMGIGLILIAVGAILTWGVKDTSPSINLDAVGVILMIVGAIGFVLSMMFWSSFWGAGLLPPLVRGRGPGGRPPHCPARRPCGRRRRRDHRGALAPSKIGRRAGGGTESAWRPRPCTGTGISLSR